MGVDEGWWVIFGFLVLFPFCVPTTPRILWAAPGCLFLFKNHSNIKFLSFKKEIIKFISVPQKTGRETKFLLPFRFPRTKYHLNELKME